jgi:Cys-tRNA(Pro)/Cys-tRNA(Cys) deacylase
MEKTNAIRMLESAGVVFEVREYPVDEEDLSAAHAAEALSLDPDSVFKTIVLRGERTGPFVCVVPGPRRST